MKPARLDPGNRMELVRGTLVLAGAPTPPSQNLHLRPIADPACHVDGIVHERGIAMVSDANPPTWMTGINWHLHPQADGSWRIVNQNEMQHCLTAVAGRLELRAAMDGFTAGPTSWLIYRQAGRDVFCLRPMGGQWLCWRDGAIGLGQRAGPDDTTVLWQLHRPHPTTPVQSPDPADIPATALLPALISATGRTLRTLGLRR